MILIIKQEFDQLEVDNLINELVEYSIPHNLVHVYGKTLIHSEASYKDKILALNQSSIIERLVPSGSEYIFASRAFKPEQTIIDVKGIGIGDPNYVNIIAGPCSVENENQLLLTANELRRHNIKFIRGGAHKPRTSPYSFQGLGTKGLQIIREIADDNDLRIITEVIDTTLIDEVCKYADVLQVGSRNMQNYYFLKELAKTDKPILLKRGMYSKVEEWLLAAEYILSSGNAKVILCERGIRTFDNLLRNTMDIAAIPLVKSLSHLPVIADPSHGTGMRNLVTPLAGASIAAGADGVMIEVHPNPELALSDGEQSLYLEQLDSFIQHTSAIAAAVNKKLDTSINYKYNLK